MGRSTSSPAQLERRQDGRASWTTTDNTLVMRAHFIAKDIVEETRQNYRKTLLEIWKDICPEREVTVAALANRVRWILEKQKLSEAELEMIRKTLRPTIEVAERTEMEKETDEQEENNRTESTYPEATTKETTTRTEMGEEDETEENQREKLCSLFKKYLLLYKGIAQEHRTPIPKVRYSKQAVDCVSKINQIISNQITQSTSILDLVDMVYAGARTVCEAQGLREKVCGGGTKTTEEPPWKKRLEKKITDIRKKVGTLHFYLDSETPSKKQERKVKAICANMRIKGRLRDRETRWSRCWTT